LRLATGSAPEPVRDVISGFFSEIRAHRRPGEGQRVTGIVEQ
jgi:hypothetical protein